MEKLHSSNLLFVSHRSPVIVFFWRLHCRNFHISPHKIHVMQGTTSHVCRRRWWQTRFPFSLKKNMQGVDQTGTSCFQDYTVKVCKVFPKRSCSAFVFVTCPQNCFGFFNFFLSLVTGRSSVLQKPKCYKRILASERNILQKRLLFGFTSQR